MAMNFDEQLQSEMARLKAERLPPNREAMLLALDRLITAAINYGSSPAGFNATANDRYRKMRELRQEFEVLL